MIVIYHGNCFDGFCAAWVAKQRHPDAVLRPALYGKPVPLSGLDAGQDVVMVDISFPRPEMEHWKGWVEEHGGTFVVLDHHKTAKEALEGFPGATFDMNKSGARLAFDYFFPLETIIPKLVMYVEDRDLWRFKLMYSKEVNAFIQTTPFVLEDWTMLNVMLETQLPAAIQMGVAILKRDESLIEHMVKHARFYWIGDMRAPVVNASVLYSEVGNRLLELHPEAKFAGYYFNRGDGVQQWGLRSRPDFDCSTIAKIYGGGGHPQAAGFQFEHHEDNEFYFVPA